jgi:hypothetical protein
MQLCCMNLFTKITALSVLSCFGVLRLNGQTIAKWNFNSNPPDASTTTGSTVTVEGNGVVVLQGTTATFATGSGSSDTASTDNTAYNTTGYPTQGNEDKGRGIAFFVNTLGLKNIKLNWDFRASNTASRWIQLQYTTDSINWIDFSGTGTDTLGLYRATRGDAWFTKNFADFSGDTTVENQTTFGVRMVTTFAPGTTGYVAANSAPAGSSTYGGGTIRYDMVHITGDSINTSTGGNTQKSDTLYLAYPLNKASLQVERNNPALVNIGWTSVDSTVSYFWKADALSGDFSAPLLRVASNKNGTDTVLTLTSGAIDAILNSVNVLQGDSITLKWTVTAVRAADSITAIDPFEITLSRLTIPSPKLNTGDLAIVAYRTSADVDDEFAVLALVDIPEGTSLMFTDSKVTTLEVPQCSNGLTWVAPQGGLKAGTVFTIGNDKGVTDTGSISGRTYGLGSSGDQIIVYEGTYYNPHYITALSSNAWVTSNTNCSGGSSLIPGTLVNGETAISHQFTKGGNGTNTMNAYYDGITYGTVAELRSAIMDTVNWNGTSVKSTQAWPTWNFFQKPQATDFSLLSPSNGAAVTVDSNDNTPVVIRWQALENAQQYVWKADLSTGDFSNPALVLLSDNNGVDTTLTLTQGGVDAVLYSLGLSKGQSIDLKWTVTAFVSNGDSFNAKAAFAIKLTRKEAEVTTPNIFKAGDMAIVGYRMNASTPDEFALLTFVNIPEGTTLRFADAKYTGTEQCDDGLVWTAPSGGVKAGTVITVLNDNPAVSVGTLTGAKFGLSSAGDQIIIWEGLAKHANHITALSSNAWSTSGITCASRSNSILPPTLTNGVTAISHEKTQGGDGSNTVNAVYTGTMEGTFDQIKALVADYRNWNGTASGTAAQTWPNWNFTGTAAQTTMLESFSFRMYPNPTSGIIYFNKAIKAQVLTLAGVCVMKTETPIQELDLHHVPAGMYLIQNEFGVSQKMVKQ